MKTCPHPAQCPFKAQPSQCPHSRQASEETPTQEAPPTPTPETLWSVIVEETLPSLPSW
jgi:hypothetical protein